MHDKRNSIAGSSGLSVACTTTTATKSTHWCSLVSTLVRWSLQIRGVHNGVRTGGANSLDGMGNADGHIRDAQRTPRCILVHRCVLDSCLCVAMCAAVADERCMIYKQVVASPRRSRRVTIPFGERCSKTHTKRTTETKGEMRTPTRSHVCGNRILNHRHFANRRNRWCPHVPCHQFGVIVRFHCFGEFVRVE